ncbi:TPA: ankyrin repeat domain-containing protein [Vibrio alginolyticus]
MRKNKIALLVFFALSGSVSAKQLPSPHKQQAANIEKATYSTLYQPSVEHNIETNLTPLHKAVISGDINQVHTLIKQGADVNGLDKLMGVAPLHLAVQGQNLEIVHLLVDNGAFVNLQSVRLGGTPLLYAVWHRNVAAVKYLLSLPDIDTSVLSASGATAQKFNRAGKYKEDDQLNADVAKINALFAAHREQLSRQSTEVAAIHAVTVDEQLSEQEKVSKIKQLITQGYDVNAIAPVLKQGTDFHSALLVAALRNQLKVAKLLLDNGADQTLPGAYMAAVALHKAAYNGHDQMLRLLSSYDGYQDVLNAQGPNNGYTPLHDAVWHGHLEAAKVLVETGARLDIKGYDGNTPLALAEKNGYPSIVEYLKKAANQ